jgi:hypothetical protein
VVEHGPVVYTALGRARIGTSKGTIAEPGRRCEHVHFIYNPLPLKGGGAEQSEAAIAQGLRNTSFSLCLPPPDPSRELVDHWQSHFSLLVEPK